MAAPITLLGGKVKLTLCPPFPNPSESSAWLAGLVPACAGNSILDAGTGGGAVALCLAARCPEITVTGIDTEPELIATAQSNAALNGANAAFEVADITTFAPNTPFNHTVANPPFYNRGTTFSSTNPAREQAHGAEQAELLLWVEKLLSLTQPGGTCTLLCHASQHKELLQLQKAPPGACQLITLQTHPSRPVKQSVLQITKAAKPSWLQASLPCYRDNVRQAVLKDGLAAQEFIES